MRTLCEPDSRIAPGGRRMCRTQRPPGTPNLFSTSGLRIRCSTAFRKRAGVAMPGPFRQWCRHRTAPDHRTNFAGGRPARCKKALTRRLRRQRRAGDVLTIRTDCQFHLAPELFLGNLDGLNSGSLKRVQKENAFHSSELGCFPPVRSSPVGTREWPLPVASLRPTARPNQTTSRYRAVPFTHRSPRR